jgi:putative molybdopterin biosynthesis protein
LRKIFRKLLDLDEAKRRLHYYYKPKHFGDECASLNEAYGRVLYEDIIAPIDVPGFDRAAMDGYAIKAEDTYGATETESIKLRIVGRIQAGEKPTVTISKGQACEVATGSPIPLGANGIIMVEYTQEKGEYLYVFKPITPGEHISSTGSDISIGETILRKGTLLTTKELGIIAAIGFSNIHIYKKPKVAIISTGDELLQPGSKLSYGKIYDINSTSIYSSVFECGCFPIFLGVSTDQDDQLENLVKNGLIQSDILITSGSTSAGRGDSIYQILNRIGKPGVIIHGLAIKPAKPTIVAVIKGKPVFSLPGYPTSALTAFHILVKPFLTKMSGIKQEAQIKVKAQIPFKYIKVAGRREFIPVRLVLSEKGSFFSYPLLSGSGAVTSYSLADGFIEVDPTKSVLEEGEKVIVTIYSREWRIPDLTLIGSHCIGADMLLAALSEREPPISSRILNVGSLMGLRASARGEADVAGIHLLHKSGEYNIPFISEMGYNRDITLFRGYNRKQGFIMKSELKGIVSSFEDIIKQNLTFINRNKGSGTRLLIDYEIERVADILHKPIEIVKNSLAGYWVEARTHSAVASAVKHGRAEIGVGIEAYAKQYNLEFEYLWEESYDFAIPSKRLSKMPIQSFLNELSSNSFKKKLEKMSGFTVPDKIGMRIQ